MLKRTIRYLALGTAGLSGALYACGSPSSGNASGTTNASVTVDVYDAAGLKVASCLGTAIASDTVLTAGHCAAGYSWWQVTSASGQVAHASIGYTYDWRAFQSAISHPDHDDVAILKLDTRIDLAEYPKLATTTMPSGSAAMRIRPASSGGVEAVGMVAYDGTSAGFPNYYFTSIDASEQLVTGGAVIDPATNTIYGVVSGRGYSTGNLYIGRAEIISAWLAQMGTCNPTPATTVTADVTGITVECGDHGPQPGCDAGTSSNGSSSGGDHGGGNSSSSGCSSGSSSGSQGSGGGSSSGSASGSSSGVVVGSSNGLTGTVPGPGGSATGAGGDDGGTCTSSGGYCQGSGCGPNGNDTGTPPTVGNGTNGGGGNGASGGGSASGGSGSNGGSSSNGGSGASGGDNGSNSGGSSASGGSGSNGGSGTSGGSSASGGSNGGTSGGSSASGGSNGGTNGGSSASGGSNGGTSGGSSASGGSNGGTSGGSSASGGSNGGTGTATGGSNGGTGSATGSSNGSTGSATGSSNGSTGGASGGDNGTTGDNGADGPGCTDSSCGGCGDDPTCSDGTEDFGGVPGSSSSSSTPH